MIDCPGVCSTTGWWIPTYLRYCVAGSGDEDLMAKLTRLQANTNTTLVRRDCINGFIGAIRPDGSNAAVD